MPNYQAVSRERHAQQRWQRPVNSAHARQDDVVPLTAVELPKAMMSLPLAFIEQTGAYVPAAVLSLLPGKDLFVTASGSWVGEYIPAAFRSYPFRLATTPDGQKVLCVDDENVKATAGSAGQAFFNEDGSLAKAVQEILNFLKQGEINRQRTAAACAVLQKHQLIRPWLINLKTDTSEQAINGLFQIDETALNQLPADALLEIRNAGALPIAYCQLLSMQHLPTLSQMAEAHAKAEQHLAANGTPDQMFFKKNETISFAGLI